MRLQKALIIAAAILVAVFLVSGLLWKLDVERILAFFETYGVVVLGLVVFGATLAIPLPASLLLITSGAFVEQGRLPLLPVMLTGLVAAVTGDHVAYFIGRRASDFARRILGDERRRKAERLLERWGMVGVFLSRWLFAPLSPTVNYVTGSMRFPLPRFTSMEVPGVAIWVVGYVSLGRVFSTRIPQIYALLTDASWVAIGIVGIVVLLYLLSRRLRVKRAGRVARESASGE